MGTKRKKRKVENDIRLAAFEKQCEMIADAVKYIQANQKELLTAEEVAKMCGMSKSTFLRLSDSGGAPASIKLERLRRWRRLEILAWISDGCPTKPKSKNITDSIKGTRKPGGNEQYRATQTKGLNRRGTTGGTSHDSR